MTTILKDKLEGLINIVEEADRIKLDIEKRSFLSGSSGDLYNAFRYVKADMFDKLAEQIKQLSNILDHSLEFSDTEYQNIIVQAEKKLDELPFGSADWQRHYGYIEGLKQVNFTRLINNDTIFKTY